MSILTPRRSSRQSVKLTQNRSPDSPPTIASRTNGTGERQEGRAEFWHRTGYFIPIPEWRMSFALAGFRMSLATLRLHHAL